MTISEFRELLEKYQNKYGDIEIYLYSLYLGEYTKIYKEDVVTSKKIEGKKEKPEYLAILT